MILIGLRGWPATDPNLPGAMNPFEYQLLETPDTIRVIHIRPAKESGASDMIECDIKQIRMDEVSYDALSYEWGPPLDYNWAILLDGHYFPVRRNLFDALLTFRREGRHSYDLPIWIDALSINQSDTRERNHQVELMGMIYRRAANVLIWLGMTDHLIAYAVEEINNSSHEAYMGTEPVWNDTVYSAIIELCQKSYWNRVWVQQEVFLGGKIYIIPSWGGFLSYQRFDHILGLMTRDTSVYGEDVSLTVQQSAANALITRKRLPIDSSRLITWLRLACHRGLETSEPRDLIYAMLGISCDCQDGGIEPDYDKPLIDVYFETIYFCGLHKPGQENVRFRKTLAEKLGLSWDSYMETKMKEYHERNITVQWEA